MAVFDEIRVLDAGGAVLATFDRPEGPLEDGRFDVASVWVPRPDATRTGARGFGIDAAGNPYYDTVAVTEGEEAELFVDGSGRMWLER